MARVKLVRKEDLSCYKDFMSRHCDITFICRDRKIVSANRAFLCGQSKLLSNLLCVDHVQGQGHMYFVTLADVKARDLEGVLELLMSGETALNGEVMDIIAMLELNVDKSSVIVIDNFEHSKTNKEASAIDLDKMPGDHKTLEDVDNEHESCSAADNIVELSLDECFENNSQCEAVDNTVKNAGNIIDIELTKEVETVEEVNEVSMMRDLLPTPPPASNDVDHFIDPTKYLEDLSEVPIVVEEEELEKHQTKIWRGNETVMQEYGEISNEKTCPYCPHVFTPSARSPVDFKWNRLRHIIKHFRTQLYEKYPELCYKATKDRIQCPVCSKVIGASLQNHLVFVHEALRGIWPTEFQDIITYKHTGRKRKRSNC